MHKYANPTKFIKTANRFLPVMAGLFLICFIAGLAGGLFFTPADYQQGDAYRIMFIHVPSAWMSLFIYVFIATMGAISLVWRHVLADILAKAAAPVGLTFTAITLVTGMIWGKPMWGAWWVWDARLTSVLVLFFLYLGYWALVNGFHNPERGAKAGAILSLVGLINIPIIKFSVNWWNSLHQPATISKLSKPSITWEMGWPLLAMFIAFFCYFFLVTIFGTRTEIARRKKGKK